MEKRKISTEERPYWECADGTTITPGSVVVAEMPGGIDHAWIYMGEFDSRAEVVTYLKNIGVDEMLITDATVGNGSGDGGRHWRIESNGSQGVVINCDTESYVVQEIKYPAVTALDTFYTDETGTLMLPNELVYGNYELHEVQSANGYVLDSEPVPFTIDGTVDTVVVEKTNKPQKGKISVQKSGDVFTSVIAGETLYTQ